MAPKAIPGTGAKSYIDPVSDYGASGNAKSNLNIVIAAGSLNTVTISGSGDSFVASDVGKVIGISYAGTVDPTKTVPKTHVTTIATYISPTQVTLTTPAVNPVSPATHPNAEGWSFAAWGADDTVPLRNATLAASASRKPIRLGWRRYLITDQIVWPDYCSMIGEGRYASVIYPIGSGYSALRYDGSAAGAPPLLAPVLRDFEIDGHGLCNSTYTTVTKGVYFVYQKECFFQNMYVHHTPATAFGCDHFIDSEWDNCWSDYGGRQVAELGGSAGGSGLGIGCGKNEYENLYINGGGASHCGKNGLFIENQTTSNPLPKGYRVNGFVADSNVVGISENGTQGAIYSNCLATRNTLAGFRVTKAFTDRFGRDAVFANCVSMYNTQGYDINTGNGQVQIIGGEVGFNTSYGIQVDDTSTTSGTPPDPTSIRLIEVDVFENGSWGFRVLPGAIATFGRVTIKGGRYWNNGAGSTTTRRPAIGIHRPVSILEVNGVRAWDDRTAGSKTQSYGLEIAAGVTVGELLDVDNDFRFGGTEANADGARNLLGTVTTSRTRALP